ncbi:hypothetical protein Ade02nite_08730 [Paractinoplanes deccanensis]|uniref:VWFA domain-containing protein n=1 Tax=Paractinoplanes deccanensis TaxID=113561 RepID=A0ABQ3XX46_9ACTN|nr:hypothetical protein [Actinoplanes deccanensis]GID72232.1 hypothetical protein Ade02nite_08730 [Actinoplanes deccanensis]
MLAGAAIVAGAQPAAAATVPLPVKAVFPGDRQTSAVVDLTASTRPGPRTAEVVVDGVRRPAELVPLMSAGLAVTIVVDTSAADPATMPAWLSAGARFILEAPMGTRATVIGDAAPAGVIAAQQRSPAGVVAALGKVRARGGRDTAAALTLAAGQYPDVPAGRKLTVVYTGAADAGGPAAAAVAERFRAAGMILVVATTAGTSPYWTAATEPTGGFFAPAGHPVVVPALDQIQTTLNGRHLVRFPTPARRQQAVPLRVRTPDLTLAADVRLPDPDAAAAAAEPRRRLTAVLAATGVLALALLVTWSLIRRIRPRRRPPPIVIAHGRATVPSRLPPPEPAPATAPPQEPAPATASTQEPAPAQEPGRAQERGPASHPPQEP